MELLQIFTLLWLWCLSFAKSLIDIEIETTDELLSLYQNKSQLLQQIYDIKNTQKSFDGEIIDIQQFEELLSRQESMLRKRNVNLTDLIGFEDPLAENLMPSRSVNEEQHDYEKQRNRLESRFYERIFFDELKRNITHFDLINIKPLTKASSGGFMTQGILMAVDAIDIILYDVYKNQLLNISMTEHGGIKLLKGSHHHDDMYILALTHTNQLWEFNITLHRIVSKGQRAPRGPAEIHKELHPVNKTKSLETGREDLFNKRYKSMLKSYDYLVEGSQWVDLSKVTNTSDIEIKQIEFYMNKGEKFYLLSDSEGHLNVFERGLTLRSRFFTGEKEIVQILKHSVAVLVVHKNDVRFVRFYRASMSSKRWHSGMSELTNVIVDVNHSGFLYGATNTGEILMFKTEGLLQNPDNIKWNIQGKLKVHTSDGGNKQLTVTSLKNYLLALKSDGTVEMFDMTSVNDFLLRPVGYNIKLSYSHFTTNEHNLPQVKTMKSYNGDLILISISPPGTSNKLVLYECLTPAPQESKDTEGFNFRMPMYFVVFFLVLIFQYVYRKEGQNSDIISVLFSCWGLKEKSKRFKSKKEKEMAEVEELVRNYTRQTDELNQKLSASKYNRY